jgi:hypothetical protein
MNAQGYKSEPLSTELELRIQNRVTYLKLHLVQQAKMQHPTISGTGAVGVTLAIGQTQGNISALEWVLREAELIKQG